MLATLILGDLVTVRGALVSVPSMLIQGRAPKGLGSLHMFGQLLEVRLLLSELLLQLQQLLPLALLDGPVFQRLLAALESVSVGRGRRLSA